MSVKFTVLNVEPGPQGSKIRTKWGMREASGKVMPYREAIVAQVYRDGLQNTGLNGPVCVIVTFTFKRPKMHYGTKKGQPYLRDNAPFYKMNPPDLDKLQRSLGDALTQSGILTDDSLIVEWRARKLYGEHFETNVEVVPLPPHY